MIRVHSSVLISPAKGVEARKGATSTCLILSPTLLHGFDFGLDHLFLDGDNDRPPLHSPRLRVGIIW